MFRNLSNMTPLEVAENAAFFLLLIFSVLCLARNSSAFNRYFIPGVCLMACFLRLLHWAEHGDEPPLLSPLVRIMASLFMG